MKALVLGKTGRRTLLHPRSIFIFQILVLIFALLGGLVFLPSRAVHASTAATCTWTGATDSSWGTASNWDCGHVPTTGDTVVINGGTTPTPTITGVSTTTIAAFQVINNASVTLNASAAATLTINGGSTGLQIDAGSSLTLGGSNAVTLALASGTSGTVSGSMTVTGAAHRLTAFSASPVTFQSGASFTAGTGFSGNAFGTANLSSIIFASGSTYIYKAGSNPFGASQPSSVVIFQTGSLYSHQGSGSPAFSGRTYANFEMNYAAYNSTSTGSGALSIDNLTMTSGALTLGMTGSFNLKGNISVASGATLNFNPASVATLTLSGSSSQIISGTGTLTFAANETVAISNTSGVTLTRDVTINGPLALTAGDIHTGANTLTLGNTNVTGANEIVGNVKRLGPFTTGTNYVFNNVNTLLNFANITTPPGDITFTLTKGDPGNGLAYAVPRKYTITPTSTGTFTTTLQLGYKQSELGTLIESGLRPYKYAGTWQEQPGSVNTSSHYVTAPSVTSFSDWAIATGAGNLPTNPSGTGSANPSTTVTGVPITLTVDVTPGTNPASAALTVTCDLTSIGGSNPVTFTNSVSNSFTYTTSVSSGTSAGSKSLACNIVDDQNRTGSTSINLTVVSVIPIGTVNGAVANTDDGTLHRSPYAPPSGNSPGSTIVTVRGVIYERTYQAIANSTSYYNGFFIQNTAATADSDPNTSDGLYVFMNVNGTIPGPNGAYTPTVGDEIVLSGSISEYYYMTEMQNPGLALVQVIRSGVDLDAELPAFVANPPINLADANRYWERRQGMRGQVPANSIVLNGRNVFSPADAEIWVTNDISITSRSDPYTQRAFRDAQPLDDNYDANNWDGNGYRILMGSWGIKYAQGDAQALLDPARTFDTVTNAPIGGINYSYSKYRLEVTTQPTLVDGVDPSTNNPPQAIDRNTAYSIADYNLENLYDYRDNPLSGCDFTTDTGCSNSGTPYLSAVTPPFDYVPASDAAYQARLNDIALEIINDLHSPDILMVQEVENQDICSVLGGVLSCDTITGNPDTKPDVLQELALKIASLGGPTYDAAFDRDSSDLRGIVPSFMYRTDRVQLLPPAGDPVLGTTPAIAYAGAGVSYNGDVSNPKTLNAVLPSGISACETSWVFPRAPDIGLFRVYSASIGVGNYQDVYVIDNHFKSGPDTCVAHRTEQAKYNAALVQYIQANKPNARIVVGGDLNVYPRPDDPFAPIGQPTSSDQLGSFYTSTLGLKNLWEVLLADHPEAAYSYDYVGMAQTLDQMFVNQPLLADLQQFRIAHINSDFPADYSGDVARGTSDHDPNVAVFKFQLDTTTTLTSSQNPSILGQSVTFTAQVTSTGPITPTGTVTFTVDAAVPFTQSLVNGSTAFSTSWLSIGTHIITATYGGDMNYNGSTKSGAQNVQYALPTITSMNPTSAPVNAPTFTLVVTGTGFVNGVSVIRWNDIDHTTTFISSTQLSTTIQKSELAAAGTVTVTVFNPTPGGGEATPALTFTIGQGNSQVTLTQSINPSVWQQSVTFTATVTQTFASYAASRPRDIAPGGTITFTDSTTGNTVCGGVAVNSWQAMCSTSVLTVGLHSIIATFSGDANYTGSTSTALSHTVNKIDTQTTLVSSLNPSFISQSVTFTATVGLSGAMKPITKSPGSPGCVFGGTVQFKDGATNLGTAQSLDASCRATFTTNTLTVGTHPITAVYSGDGNYNGNTSNQVNQVVNSAKIYLPLIDKNFADAPNLVVTAMTVITNDVQVTIRNIGTKPVVDDFWVDVYINPTLVPTQVNQTWQMMGSQGIVWGVLASTSPIKPGETRTLSIANDPNHYYWSSLSNFKLPLTNATVYVQVDSANAGVWYGAVLENHEIAGTVYDNIRKFAVTSGVVTLPVPAPRDLSTLGDLPPRP